MFPVFVYPVFIWILMIILFSSDQVWVVNIKLAINGFPLVSTTPQIVPYGSVPLKSYLPDGDIDLTALSATKSSDTLASDIRAILEKQQKDNAGYYEIHDVQFIDAEVNTYDLFLYSYNHPWYMHTDFILVSLSQSRGISEGKLNPLA